MQSRMKFLFVDSNSSDLSSLSEQLLNMQVMVEVANSSEAAMAKLHAETPQLLVIAAELGEKSGLDFYQQVQSQQNINQIPIFITSAAENARELFRKHQEAGNKVQSYLEKPIDIYEFLDALDDVQLLPNLLQVNEDNRAEFFEEMRSQITKLHTDNQKLLAVVEQYKKNEMELKQLLQKANEQINSAAGIKGQADVAQKQVQELTQQNQQLTAKVREASEKLQTAQKASTDLQAQNQKLQTQLSSQSQNAANIEGTWQKKQAELEAKHKEVQEKLRNFYRAQIEKLQKA